MTMIGFACSVVLALVAAKGNAEVLQRWSGDGMKEWTKTPALHCQDVRFETGCLKGTITGRDPQLFAKVDKPFLPRDNQYISINMRVGKGGNCQVFWKSSVDRAYSAARCVNMSAAMDGKWNTYRMHPRWSGKNPITELRFDFPAYAVGAEFEVASVEVFTEGEPTKEIFVDTRENKAVSFQMTMPKGQHYCSLCWYSDTDIAGQFGFTPATDGRRHTYSFDLRKANMRGSMRGKLAWTGNVTHFTVEDRRSDKLLPAQDIAFYKSLPDTPADVTILHAAPGEAIPRAGRDFPLDVAVRNFGTRASGKIELAFDGLPAGVRLVDPASAVLQSLPGADGGDTICADCRPALASEHLFHPVLGDLGVGRHAIGITMKVDGNAVCRETVEVEVKPSLNLAARAYPDEPKPIDTRPYEIGAFLFPGWVTHQWHAVWLHALWRKPLLGWYDETNPATIDWQIKYMVENGISFVSVDWYWSKRKLGTHHWMEAFAKARFRKYLKWSVMWANHNGKGSHSVEDQELVTKYWVDHYFSDPQYQRIDDMPVVAIWSAESMEQDMEGKGGCKALLEVSQRVVQAAGYKGIYFIALRPGDSAEKDFLKTFADRGFKRTCCYKYVGKIPGCPNTADYSVPFKFVADTSYDHWKELERNSTIPFIPSLTTSWDNRPWLGNYGWAVTGTNVGDFRRICTAARRYSDETNTRMLLLGPLDEWGEGSIGYPNHEFGFGFFEAVRDVFGKKPAAGWPLNYAPEDVGLVCPQQ